MRLLLTGGAGFMGSNMVRFLLNKRHDVEILNIDKLTYAGNPDNLRDIADNPRYSFLKADIADRGAMERAFKQFSPDAVINYAAETHVDRSISRPFDFAVTDVIGTLTLLECSRLSDVKRYVQISTDEVYGSTDTEAWDETAPFDPSSPYSASKAGGDHLVRAYWKTYGFPGIVTHSCNFYGPFQYPEKIIPLFITNLLERKKVPVYGDGTHIREWIFVPDHCSAIETILDRGMAGDVYNIGTGFRVTNMELTNKIISLLGENRDSIEFVKDRPGHDRRYALDSSKIRDTLGWKPLTSFDEGLHQTVKWYQDHEPWWKRIKSGDYLKYYTEQYRK